MNYLEFFGFQKEPFSTAPDTRFYFDSKQHSQAMLRLTHAIENMRGLAVLIGDVGTGKTMLARRLLDSLNEKEYESALLIVIHSNVTSDWFLKKIAMQFGISEIPDNKLELISVISKKLVNVYEEGKKAVVLVDEAQMLGKKEIMEELRGLLNIELPERKLITFVLFGLPELDNLLKLDPPLAQRVSLRFWLRPFDEYSTEEYIKHRIRLAGGKDKEIFAQGTFSLIHKFSRGIPRTINTICDNSLFEAYLLKKKIVDEDVVRNVAIDLGLEVKEEEVVEERVEEQAEELYNMEEIEGMIEDNKEKEKSRA